MDYGDRQSPAEPVKAEIDEDAEDLNDRLSRLPGPEYMSTRPGPGGKKIHYLTGEKTTRLAHEVFGTNGWSSSVSSLTTDELEVTSSGIRVAVTAIVKVTCLIPNKYGQVASHEDVGTAFYEGTFKQKAEVIDRAKKTAVTDARKRALRQFGNATGLFLTDTDAVKAVLQQQVPLPSYQMHRKSMSVSRTGSPPLYNHLMEDRLVNGPSAKRRAIKPTFEKFNQDEKATLTQLAEQDWEVDF